MAFSHTTAVKQHKGWVRSSHWIVTISFLLLAFTGFEMVMVHPRFYWGEVGNDLTPAAFELPVSRNYKHGGWDAKKAFYAQPNSPVSASRTYDIFNENGWGRSLHFLAAWFLIAAGIIYLLTGIFTGHFRRNIWPKARDLQFGLLWRDLTAHFRKRLATNTSQYGLLQRTTYAFVIFILLPIAVLTGFTMSPAITAAYPFLLKIFLGGQSARTIHFFASLALELFLVVHVVMIMRTGFKQQMKAMTIG